MAMAEGTADEQTRGTDPVDEILSYLPARNLQSLKRVSKDWLQLISSPYFVRLHHSRAYPRRIRILIPISNSIFEYNDYDDADPATKRMTYPPPLGESGPQGNITTGSTDGLICMFDCSGGHGVLFNPSTKKCAHLWPHHSPEFLRIHFSWFGKITADGDYVLVMVVRRRSSMPRYELVVYKLRALKLKRIQSKFFDIPYGEGLMNCFEIVERGTHLNEALYWPVIKNITQFTILVEENRFREILPPAQCFCRLGVTADGCLFTVVKNEVERVFEVWVMRDSWEKMANIEGFNLNSTQMLIPLEFCPDGDLILDVNRRKLMKYSFKDNRAMLLVQYPYGRTVYDAIMCADTLVSPSNLG